MMYGVVRGCSLLYGAVPCVFPGVGGPKGLQMRPKAAPKALQTDARIPPADAASNLVFWWTPVGQNITMPGPETELYGVKWHSGVVRRRCPAPGCPGLALGTFSEPPWA